MAAQILFMWIVINPFAKVVMVPLILIAAMKSERVVIQDPSLSSVWRRLGSHSRLAAL